MKNCVVLDDYQNAALSSARWDRIADRVAVSCIHEYLPSEDEVVARLGDADIVVAMRERTPFPARLLDRLPKLQLSSPAACAMPPSTSRPPRPGVSR